MKKFVAVYTVASLLVLLIASQAADFENNEHGDNNHHEQDLLADDYDDTNEPTDAELQLNRMLSFVTPLMAILRSEGQRRSGRRGGRMSAGDEPEVLEEGRSRGRRPPYSNSVERTDRYGDYPSASGYGGGYGGGGYGGGYGGGCCNKKDDLLPILALVALSLLLLYLIAIATTTTTGKRRKRSWDQDGNLIGEDIMDIELLDAPTWISLVNQIWTADDAMDETNNNSDSCTLKALCRMNHLALASPGSSGVLVSLSSIPLSYLLHRRHHEEGFMRYLDASLLGHNGVNCTDVFSSCPRLN